MSFLHNRKHKIDLLNYNYSADLENRLFMSKLSTLELHVLKEIINGSLKCSLQQLEDNLEIDQKTLKPIIKKLSASKLFQCIQDIIIVDKAKRKYFETQIVKFEENFEPGMEFLQSVLSKVPIHVLPEWYAIPKTSSHIFSSIIEKYLLTPKIYEKHLSELTFEDPVLHSIYQEVFKAPDYLVTAQYLMEKYHLSHEQFEKNILLLEYHLVCCLSYRPTKEGWEEVVTPFSEWRQYLRFRRDTHPKTISSHAAIQRVHSHDFGFINDLKSLLEPLQKKPMALNQSQCLSLKDPPYISLASAQSSRNNLIAKALQFQFTKLEMDGLSLQPIANKWLGLSPQDQALFIYRQPLAIENAALWSDRDMREIERNLKRVMKSGWIFYEDFLEGFTAEIGRSEPITLKNKGKRWKYVIPSYLHQELDLVKAMLCGKFFEAGLVALGTFHDKLCFCVTPFGQVALE